MELGPKYVARLQTAIRRSDEMMRAYEQHRTALLHAFVGGYYGAEEGNKATPLNLLYLTVVTYVANLVAISPAVRLRTRFASVRPYATALEYHLNDVLRTELRAERIARRLVFDSLFGAGFSMVGTTASERGFQTAGGEIPLPRLVWDRVDQDDIVLDPLCRCPEEALWMGHRFRQPLHHMQATLENVEELTALTRPNRQAVEGSEGVGGATGAIQELTEFAEAYQVFIPSERLVVVIPKEGQGVQCLSESEWTGPGYGPYCVLGYTQVPNRPLPLPPLSALYDLHVMANALMRKVYRQAANSKTVTLAERGYEDDARNLAGAADGEVITVKDAQRVRQETTAGPSAELVGALSTIVQLFSREAGNLDLIGGLASKFRTASEASLVQGNASIRLGDLSGIVHSHVRDCCEILGHAIHESPFLNAFVEHRITNTPLNVPIPLNQMSRRGDWGRHITLEIVPYSMAPRDPEKYAQKLLIWATQWVLPTLQFAQAQGNTVDIGALTRLLAREWDLFEADEVFIPATPTSDMLALAGLGGAPVPRNAMPADQERAVLAQAIHQKLPAGQPNQAPSNMDIGALRALATA